MTTGFRIRNQESGDIQIGSGYNNLELIKSGTLNSGNFLAGGGPLSNYSESPYGYMPSTSAINQLFVVWFPTTDNRFGFSIWRRIWNGVSNVAITVAQNSPQKIIEYYIFGNANSPATGSVGLRMKDESGNVYYDSRKKQLRVLQAISLPAMTETFTHIGQFFPGKRIGLALANPRFSYFSPYPERCTMFCDHLSMDSSNNVWIGSTPVSERVQSGMFKTGQTTLANTDATLLIIDLEEIPLGFG